LREELQQKEMALHAKLKQPRTGPYDHEDAARETELQNQWTSICAPARKKWSQQTEARVRATETRLAHGSPAEAKRLSTRKSDPVATEELQSQFDARQTELKSRSARPRFAPITRTAKAKPRPSSVSWTWSQN